MFNNKKMFKLSVDPGIVLSPEKTKMLRRAF